MEPVMTTINSGKEPKPAKKENKFVRVLKAIFVHNIGYKLLAVAGSIVLWILAVAL